MFLFSYYETMLLMSQLIKLNESFSCGHGKSVLSCLKNVVYQVWRNSL